MLVLLMLSDAEYNKGRTYDTNLSSTYTETPTESFRYNLRSAYLSYSRVHVLLYAAQQENLLLNRLTWLGNLYLLSIVLFVTSIPFGIRIEYITSVSQSQSFVLATFCIYDELCVVVQKNIIQLIHAIRNPTV